MFSRTYVRKRKRHWKLEQIRNAFTLTWMRGKCVGINYWDFFDDSVFA